jgi:hypothetical protein
MAPNKQVSPVIRISQGERDASARATHLEAATRKFLVTTNERKQMSTTTNFKRIALVAVAALGFGTLSAIPASADVSGVTIAVTNGATPLAVGETTKVNSDTGTATGATVTVSYLTTAATDSVTVGFYNKNALSNTSGMRAYLVLVDSTTVNTKVSVAGAGAFSAINKNTSTSWAVADSITAGVSGTSGIGLYSGSGGTEAVGTRGTGNVGATFALFIDTRSVVASAGTYTYTVVVTQYVGTTAANMVTKETSADVSIVVSASTAATTVPSAVTTTFFMGAAATTVTSEAAVTPKVATNGTNAAGFTLDINNASGNNATDTVTVTVSGPGTLGYSSVVGIRSAEVVQTGPVDWTLKADGTAGVSTITFKTARTGLTFTRTVSFYSAKAGSIVAANFSPVLRVGTNDAAIAVTAKDALGAAWTGTAYIYASSAADALIAGSETPGECGAYSADTGLILCPVSGKLLGTAKFKVIDAATVAAANATSNEVTVSVKAATAASVKIAFNKATYAPGEKALVTVTPVAADGTNLPATTVTNALAAGGITSSVQLGSGSQVMDSRTITTSAYSSAASNLVAGGMTYVVYMPVVGGTVKLTAEGSTGLPIAGQVEVSATATVTDNAAAALAAVTALATTVASLRTLITTLTNLVLKIQKKVKA